ncbi:MAG: hypothetical protein OXT67_08065 [Zetaproteobacteria bacterium]|nr:hypothetical protein [Zetaproteobacteria bacterium]
MKKRYLNGFFDLRLWCLLSPLGWLLAGPVVSAASVCQKFKGKYIAYYSQVFYVNDACRRIPMTAEEVYKQQRAGARIVDVSGEEVAAIPMGKKALISEDLRDVNAFCRSYREQYLTVGYVEYYWINRDCVVRKFPDWATYENHRGELSKSHDLVVVEGRMRRKLKQGKDFPSVLDREFHKIDQSSYHIDLLPMHTVCAGLQGAYVSYLESLYMIEPRHPVGCQKRKLDAERFTRSQNKVILRELTSSEAYSIPTVVGADKSVVTPTIQ